MNAIPFVDDIDYNDADYIHDLQGDYDQGESPKSYIQDLIDINSMGKDPSERAKLKTLGDAYEKLMAGNDDILWNTMFGM